MRNQQANLVSHDRLRSLVEVARAGGFAAAADRLGLTPQAVSLQMKALEVQLGVALFERVGRRNVLTEAGGRIATLAEAQLPGLEEAVLAVAGESTRVRGLIRLGAPAPFSRIWLRPRLLLLLREHPELEVSLRFEVPSVLAERLARGELDLALLSQLTDEAGLEQRPIYREEFVAVAAPDYLRRQGTPASAAEFRAHDFIVFDGDRPMHAAWWRAAFGPREPEPSRLRCRVGNLFEMQALVEGGVGIAILPSYLVGQAVEEGAVRILAPRRETGSSRPAVNTLYLAWRRAAPPISRLVAVREALLRDPQVLSGSPAPLRGRRAAPARPPPRR